MRIRYLLLIFKPIQSLLPVQLIIKKFLIICLFYTIVPSKLLLAASDNIDRGIIALMYHRFDENKYPSTNIKMKDFIKQINLIKENNFYFINANQFETDLLKKKNKKKILITIDDGFLSFYKNAWPVLKKNKIPFILFVSTKEVGSRGYMNWEQIKEIANENFVHIGNHSHSHGYLINQNDKAIINDINKSITIF